MQAESGTSLASGPEAAEGLLAFPASFAQQRLWFVEQVETEPGLYNVPCALRLSGRLDVRALEAALNEIIARHEVLRTTFAQLEGQLMQLIAPRLELRVEVEDLSMLPAGRERDEEMWRRIRESAARTFDLRRGPLLEARLLRLEDEEHLLLLVFHHIVSDGWSMGVFFREFGVLYESFGRGEPSPLEELPIQYADYSEWQRQWLTGEVLDRQLGYWKEQLRGGAFAPLELPTTHGHTSAPTHRGAFESLTLDDALRRRLVETAQREGVTLFMLLLAAWQALLHRYTGQREIRVGTAIANRGRPELENLIGFFVNTLVLAADVDARQTFRELLARVRDVTLGAYAHQDVPFERLVEGLNPERSTRHTPLFEVMFVLQNMPRVELNFSGLTLRPMALTAGVAKFDLTLIATEADDGLRLVADYKTDLFDAEAVGRTLRHYRNLLEGIVADPARRVVDYPLLDEAERRRVLAEWNDTAGPYPSESCVHHLFEAQAERTPDREAVSFEGERLTYAQLNERANRLARRLRRMGVGPEVRAGIMLDRGPLMVETLLAVLKAGGAYVPLDAQYPRERLCYMAEDSGMSMLLTDSRLAEELGDLACARVVNLDLERAEIDAEGAENFDGGATARNLAYIIYTSGSTGLPKGVMVEHRGLCNLAAAQAQTFGLGATSRVLQFASLSFDASIFEVVMALTAGATLSLATRETLLPGPDLIRLLQEGRVTTATLPPSVLASLPDAAFPSLDTLTAAGEACPPDVAERWAPGRRFFNLYGPTEATVWSTAARLEGGEQKPPIGRPVLNTRAYVLDSALRPAPAGVRGELYLSGVGLARGYVNQPALTAERFVPDPFSGERGARMYRTGDLARHLPDGQLEFLGRADQQVKIRGFRIELGEIETLLRHHAGVRDACVIDREAAGGGRQLVAYVVPSDRGGADAHELRKYLKGRLPAYMVPAAFVGLDALPLTINGKLDVHALPEPDWTSASSGRVFTPPRNFKEQVLVEMWENFLGVGGVGVEDNFFEVGGNSLVMMQVIGAIQKAFDVSLPVAAFYESPTVEAVAEEIRRLQKSPLLEEAAARTAEAAARTPLVPLHREGSALPLFCAHSVGGHLGEYRELARALGASGQPVYGLQARGLDDDSEPYASIEEMAAAYVEAVLDFQPHGPYRLGGYCSGGLVAFEMAQQLRRLGHEVSTLALIGSQATLNESASLDEVRENAAALAVVSFSGELKIVVPEEELRALAPPERMRRVWDEFRRQSPAEAERIGETIFRRLFRTYVANVQALAAYVPRPYHGYVGLFEFTEHQGKLRTRSAWADVARGTLDRYEIPGNHITLMRPPHVLELARKLDACLNGERKVVLKWGARAKSKKGGAKTPAS